MFILKSDTRSSCFQHLTVWPRLDATAVGLFAIFRPIIQTVTLSLSYRIPAYIVDESTR